MNPAVRIEREAAKALLHLAEHYGLTPVARVRLGLSELKRKGLQAELAAKYTGRRRRTTKTKTPRRRPVTVRAQRRSGRAARKR